MEKLAEMMMASGYPYAILIEGVLAEGDTGFIFKEGDLENSVGQINMTVNDDYRIVAGDHDFTFVDPTDAIMWIVQNL
jgi:hypothetical protein